MCQPEIKRFSWELEVILTNLKILGFPANRINLLFSIRDGKTAKYLHDKYKINVFRYIDNRDDTSYIPSIRPYLWSQWLKEYPDKESGTYLYIDSDLIFRKMPDWSKLVGTSEHWYCADTRGYLGLKYILSRKQGTIIEKAMQGITHTTPEQIEKLDKNIGGAQWIINNPTQGYWNKVYHDSNCIWHYLENTETDLQKWTAEMWAMDYNLAYFGISPQISDELSFSWSTDPIESFSKHNILHNAGVIKDGEGMFFKGKYVDHTPFKEDFSWINKEKCSYKYVQAIKAVE